jgi:WD40 repeat protein
MRTDRYRLALALIPVLVACGNGHSQVPTAGEEPFGTIPLPNVHGRIDHLAEDTTSHRVFIAALGNNSVEVVDLAARKHIASISGIEEPQGIVFIPEDSSVLVASGGDGSCNFYRADDLGLKRTIKLDKDADNVRYSPTLARIFIGHGDGAIAVIDARTFVLLTDIPVGGHPESLRLDERAQRLFVNVPDERVVRVIDLATMKVIESWEMTTARSNFPMALDTAAQLVIIGCRSPARLLFYDYHGLLRANLDAPGDLDDLFVNGSTLFAIAGEGTVAAYEKDSKGVWMVRDHRTTRAGARTGLLLHGGRELLVAAPARSGEEALLMILPVEMPR